MMMIATLYSPVWDAEQVCQRGHFFFFCLTILLNLNKLFFASNLNFVVVVTLLRSLNEPAVTQCIAAILIKFWSLLHSQGKDEPIAFVP